MDQRCSLITQWKCCGTEAGGGFKIRIRKILRATVFSSFVPTMIKGKFKNNFLKINNFFLVRAGCCKKFVKNSKKPSFLLELEPAKNRPVPQHCTTVTIMFNWPSAASSSLSSGLNSSSVSLNRRGPFPLPFAFSLAFSFSTSSSSSSELPPEDSSQQFFKND